MQKQYFFDSTRNINTHSYFTSSERHWAVLIPPFLVVNSWIWINLQLESDSQGIRNINALSIYHAQQASHPRFSFSEKKNKTKQKQNKNKNKNRKPEKIKKQKQKQKQTKQNKTKTLDLSFVLLWASTILCKK